MDEVNVYLDNPTCKVTSKYLIINSQKFKIADINGVFVTRQVNNRRYPISLGILGFIIALSTDSLIVGIVSVLIILAAIFFMPTKYHLRLKIGIGEARPAYSTNRAELDVIKKAVESAISELNE